MARVVKALRAKFPDVRIYLRADSGYAVPVLYETCEDLHIDYSIGMYGCNCRHAPLSNPTIGMNSRHGLQWGRVQ